MMFTLRRQPRIVWEDVPFYTTEPFAGLWKLTREILGSEFWPVQNIHVTGDWDTAVEQNLSSLCELATNGDDRAFELLRDWAGSKCAYQGTAMLYRDEAAHYRKPTSLKEIEEAIVQADIHFLTLDAAGYPTDMARQGVEMLHRRRHSIDPKGCPLCG